MKDDISTPTPEGAPASSDAALRESEARLRLLLDSLAQAVWETDAEGVVVADSPSWRAYTGQTLDEWLGYGWLNAIHPDDRDYAERQWREAVATRSLVNAEFRLRSPDGGYRWTNVRAAPLLDAEGNIEKWEGMNIDIDDRKRAEAAVREVDQRYRLFFDATNVALVILEFEFDEAGQPTDFRHVHINPALEGISGFKRNQILGRLVTEMAPPEEAREWIDFYAPVLTSGEPAVLERFSPTMNRWIKVSAARFGPRQVAAVFENTTAQKSAEQALRESEERQAFLLRFSDALRPLTNPAEVKTKGMELLAEQLDVMRASYFEFEEDEDHFQVTERSERDAPPIPERMRMSDFSPAMYELFKSGGTLSIEDATVAGEFVPDPAAYAAIGVQALAGVGLVRGGRLVACIGVHSRTPRRWSPAELQYLTEVGERTWSAVEQARAEAALRESEEQQAFLLQLSDALATSTEPADIQAEVTRQLAQRLGTGWCYFNEFDERGTHATVLNDFHRDDLPSLVGVHDLSKERGFLNLMHSGAMLDMPDLTTSAHFSAQAKAAYGNLGIRSALGAPLLRKGRLVAVLLAADPSVRLWSQGDAELLRGAAERTWTALQRARSEKTMRENEERQAFLLKFSDALRGEIDADAVGKLAMKMLFEELRLDRCYAAEFRPGEDWADYGQQLSKDELPPLPPGVRPSGFPEAWKIGLETTIVVHDTAADPALSESDKQNLEGLAQRAFIAAMLRDGAKNPCWVLTAASSRPRRWTAGEIALVEEAAERTWAAMERARAEASLRTSEERYRTLFESMGQGFCELELVRDHSGRAVDQHYLRFNPAFERIFGLPVREAEGRLASEIFPELEPVWTEMFDRVSRTGRPDRIEHALGDRWFEVFAHRQSADRLAVFYEEISDRKQAEEALRESEERQAFLLKLSDAVRSLEGLADIQGETTRLLREQLNAGWCYYVEWDLDRKVGLVLRDSVREGRPSLAGPHDVSDVPEFLQLLGAGTVLTVEDYANYEQLSTRIRQQFVALGFRSMMVAPLLEDERLTATLIAGDTDIRNWSAGEASLFAEAAERTRASIERARAEEALRSSEEQLRLIVESARDYAIFTTDENDVIDNWLPGAESVFGWSKEEAEGQPGAILFTPADREVGEPEKEIETARREGKAPDVRWHLRKDGSLVFIEGQVVPLRGGDEEIDGYLKIGQDVTDRRMAENALRESEERLRQFGEASSAILWMRDARTLRWTYLSNAFETIYGESCAQALAGNTLRNWVKMILPEDRGRAIACMREVRKGERRTFEYRIRRSDGEVRWLRNTDFPIRNSQGDVVSVGGIGVDITALKQAERHQQTLLAGLQHRVRNTLAVVRSIARRTAESSSSAEDMLAHFQGRLDAFSRVQAALTRNAEGTVELMSLIEDELVAHAAREGGQVRISGPAVSLDPKAAERLSLAVHELTTNAVKHGALVGEEGRIKISWKTLRDGAGTELVFDWKESGVEIDLDSVKGDGFGMELLRRSLAYDLGAESKVELKPQGLQFELRMPLPQGS